MSEANRELSFLYNLGATTELTAKAIGTGFLHVAATAPIPTDEIRALLSAGAVGLIATGEIIRLSKTGELKELSDLAYSKSIFHSAEMYLRNRVGSPRFWSDAITNISLTMAVNSEIIESFDEQPLSLRAALLAPYLYNSLRHSLYLVGAMGRGVFTTAIPLLPKDKTDTSG